MPTPGETLRLADGRTAQLVDAGLRPDGKLEFLAVAPYAAMTDGRETGGAEEAVSSQADGTVSAPLLDAKPLPLPYALPD
jgi:hypothetical protein